MTAAIGPYSASLAYQRASLAARAGEPVSAPNEEPRQDERTRSPDQAAVGRRPRAGFAGQIETQEAAASGAGEKSGPEKSGGKKSGEELSEEEKKQVSDLRKRDAEVRAHENAHAGAGGAHAGSPSYEMQRGPDGKAYAVGGEVAIDTSAESTPEATARKMDVVIRAALAPADPSPQDQRVAAAARQTRVAAQAEARKLREAEQFGGDDEASEASGPSAIAEPGEAQGSGEVAASGEAPAVTPGGNGTQGEHGLPSSGEAQGAAVENASGEVAKPTAPGIFGPVGGGAGNGTPIFGGSGELVGFSEDDGEASGDRQADVRLAASRAYGDRDTRALLEALSRL